MITCSQFKKSGRQGAWLGIDFTKAFDSTSHALLGFFLEFLGVPETWCAALIQFLKGPLQFFVGNQLTESALYPGTGIKQGDTLSPTIFSLLTVVFIEKVLHGFLQVQSFLFANDTLFFIQVLLGK